MKRNTFACHDMKFHNFHHAIVTRLPKYVINVLQNSKGAWKGKHYAQL